MIRVVFDLDLDDPKEIYRDALDTKKYLEDVIESIEDRVINQGEQINGLCVVEGRKTRALTKEGFNYLVSQLGEDKMYEKKELGITKIEKLLSKEDMVSLETNGFITFKPGKAKLQIEE